MKAKKVSDMAEHEGAELPRPREVEVFTQSARADVEGSLAIVRALEITTPPEAEFAAGALQEVAARHDAIDAKRKSWVEPLKRVAKDIDATFKPLLDGLKEAEELLKGQLAAFASAREQARGLLLKGASEAAQRGDSERASALIEQAEWHVPVELAGVSVKPIWTGEVLDAALLPREFLAPDLKKLEAVTKATGADPNIPGWRAFPTAQVRTSRKGGA